MMSSLPGSEIDFSEPGSSFTITSGSVHPNNPKLQNLDHTIKLQAELFAKSGSHTDAQKLIYYIEHFNGSLPYTVEQAVDTAISEISDPSCLELLLHICTKWPDSEHNTYSLVLKMFASFEKLMPIAVNLPQLCTLMIRASSNDFVSQNDILALSRHIINFLVRDADSIKKRHPLKLLISIFKDRPEMQSPILDLTLQYLRKPLEYVRDQPISKYSEKKINALSVLVLQFIQSAGALPLEYWDEAAAYSRRASLVEKCKTQIRKADEIINEVVRACMDILQSETVQSFIDDVLMALEAPELCASEMLVRCFTITLLLQCKSYHNRYQLPPPYVFETLTKIQRPLYTIFKAQESDSLGQIIDYLVSDGYLDAAVYFATLELTTTPTRWREYQVRFSTPQSRVASMATKRWLQVLKGQKIGQMYQHSVDVLLILSESGGGAAYIEILKSLATAVYEHPELFKKIEQHLMSQLGIASSFVCDWTAHIVSNYIAATEVDFSLVARTMVRVKGPGNLNYKKRCIKLLDQAYQSGDGPLQSLAWKYLLLLSDDPKATIAQLASKQLCDYIDNSEPEKLYPIFHQVLRLSSKYGQLISAILRKPLKRAPVHQFVAYLLKSLQETPDYQQLKVASLFIAANGLFLPPSKVPILVELSVALDQTPENRLIVLKMLEICLTAKPRVLISPKVVADLYKKMLGMLALYTEHETESAGRIIWQLANMGRPLEMLERQNELAKMYEASLAALKPTTTPKVLSHLLSITSVGATVWTKDGTGCIPALLKLTGTTLRLQVIRVLCRVCTRSPHLFLEGPCHDFFKSEVFGDKKGSEWGQFMAVFLEFLESQDFKVENKTKNGGMSATVLHGHDESLVAESTLGGLFRTYFDALEFCALDPGNKSGSIAAKLLCRGITTSKVDPSICTKTVVTMCCSPNVEISQVAHECLATLVEHKQLAGFAKGIAAAGRVPAEVFQRLLEDLGTENIEPIMNQIVETFTVSADFAKSVFNGLVAANLKPANARYMELKLDDLIYNFNGEVHFEALAVVLRAILQYKYASDSTATLVIPQAEFVFESVDPDELRNIGDYQEVLEAVNELKSSKRVRR